MIRKHIAWIAGAAAGAAVARGGLSGKLYPWGDEFRPGGKYMANTYQGKFPPAR